MNRPSPWITLELDPGVAQYLDLPVTLHLPLEEDTPLPDAAGGGFDLDRLAAGLARAAERHPEMAADPRVLRFPARVRRLRDLETYVTFGNTAFAERVARSLLEEDRTDPAALAALGGLALAGERYADARGLLEQALERAPSHTQTRIEAALARAGEGEIEEAVTALADLLPHPRARSAARLWMHELRAGRTERLGRRLAEARALFRRFDDPTAEDPDPAELERLFPGNPEALAFRATHPRGAADDEERAALLGRALAVEPRHEEARVMRITLLRRAGQAEEALAAAEEGLALDPSSSPLRAALGQAREQIGAADAARDAYRGVFEGPLAQVNPAALLVAGQGLLRVGRAEETRLLLEDAIAARPGDPLPHQLLARLEELDGHPDEAEKRLRAALRECGPVPRLHYALGDHLRRRGREIEARGVFRMLVEKHPREPWGHRGLGDLEVRTQPTKSMEHYARALERDPWTPIPGHDYLRGVAELRAGNLEEAEAWLARAVAGEPDNARSWCDLGAVRFYRGRWAEAVAATERAVRLDDTDPGFLHNLATFHRARFRAHPLTGLKSLWIAWTLERRLRKAAPAWRKDLWGGPGSDRS